MHPSPSEAASAFRAELDDAAIVFARLGARLLTVCDSAGRVLAISLETGERAIDLRL